MKSILVIGSSNIDMIAEVDHIPAPGETVGDAKYSMHFGGKGANQAMAAAKSGGDVTFITRVGKDAMTKHMIESFIDNGINCKHISYSDNYSTGVAFITVDKKGENIITVAPEANGELSPHHINDKAIEEASLIVLQMEIPYQTIKAVAIKAKALNTLVLLNPAPAAPLDPVLWSCLDYLVVNETEAEILSGLSLKSEGIDNVLSQLSASTNGPVILTRGKYEGYFIDHGIVRTFNSFTVNAVDTTGAGDTFCGALAVKLSNGVALESALQFASSAAAISVTRKGAHQSAPDLSEIEYFMKNDSQIKQSPESYSSR